MFIIFEITVINIATAEVWVLLLDEAVKVLALLLISGLL